MPMDSLLEVVEANTMETREKAKFMTEFGMGELLRRDIEEEVVLLPRLRMDMGVQDLGGVIGNGRRWFLMAWSRRGSFNLLGLWGKILGVGAFRYLVGSLGMERESGTVCEQWVS